MNIALNNAGQQPAETDEDTLLPLKSWPWGMNSWTASRKTPTPTGCATRSRHWSGMRARCSCAMTPKRSRKEVRGARDRGTALLLVMGGLGPTPTISPSRAWRWLPGSRCRSTPMPEPW